MAGACRRYVGFNRRIFAVVAMYDASDNESLDEREDVLDTRAMEFDLVNAISIIA